MYPSKPKPRTSYGLLTQYRAFKPPDLLAFLRDQKLAVNLRSKMKRFHEDTMTERYTYCKSIYRASPVDQNVTLARLLMSLKATSRPGKYLFHMIEQDYDGDALVFHYHKNTHQQAYETITTLPLFVEAVLGKGVAQEWFTEDAWFELDGYKYELVDNQDALKGVRIKCLDEDNWQDSDDDFDVGEFQNAKDGQASDRDRQIQR